MSATWPHALRILARPGEAALRVPWELPWHLPLEEWQGEWLVEVPRGVHRHVVRFVQSDGVLYALKELPEHLAHREYRLLRQLREDGLPAVAPVAVFGRDDLPDILVTRYLEYSLPYRTLFAHIDAPTADGPSHQSRTLHDRLLDAQAMLLVRLHSVGFFWGDCSLSNTLFRRDAGALAAYVVDVETGERHDTLTDGQRAQDLDTAEENVAGGLTNLQAEFGLPPDPDPIEAARDLRQRYERIWDELTSAEEIRPNERHRLEARIRRLNELGFDVEEVEVVTAPGGEHLLLTPVVVEQGHHRRRLQGLTGLSAQENQARSMLNDLANFRASLLAKGEPPLPESVVAYRWLNEIFEPTIAAIPEALRGKREAAELFHEMLEHKWQLSQQRGVEVSVQEGLASYVDTVLPQAHDEATASLPRRPASF